MLFILNKILNCFHDILSKNIIKSVNILTKKDVINIKMLNIKLMIVIQLIFFCMILNNININTNIIYNKCKL